MNAGVDQKYRCVKCKQFVLLRAGWTVVRGRRVCTTCKPKQPKVEGVA